MTLSTSVTKQQDKRFKKTAFSYLGLAIFLLVFGQMYQHFSYGESSPFMQGLFLPVFLGGGIFLAILKFRPQTSRLSMNLWNTSLAILTSGCLLRGIINLSGRATSYDILYWILGGACLVLATFSLMLTESVWE